MTKVSIIMNCYNSDKYLRQAIDSIYAQTYTDWEIIFWDNKSTDNSAKIAQSYDSKLKYFLADEFLSLGAARNKAIEMATGDYITFLDCDDEWLPLKLDRQIEYLKNYPEVNFIYSNSYFINTLYNTKRIEHYERQPEGNIFYKQLNKYSVSLMTVIFHRSLLAKLDHIFDARFHIIEEYDLFMRLFVFANVGYISEPLAIYRIHGENGFIKGRKQWVVEMRQMLEKFNTMEEILALKEKDWDKTIKNNIAMEAVKLYILNGDNKLARRELASVSDKSKVTQILFLLTLQPPVISKRFYKILSEIYKEKVIYKG